MGFLRKSFWNWELPEVIAKLDARFRSVFCLNCIEFSILTTNEKSGANASIQFIF